MAVRKHRKIHDVGQLEKIPFITDEIAFRQHVCEFVSGVNIFDLYFGVQVDCVKQPSKYYSVGSRHVSHSRTLAFNDHLDH